MSPTFDPDLPRVKRLAPSSPYKRGVLDTLLTVYDKAYKVEDMETFRTWLAIQLENCEEE